MDQLLSIAEAAVVLNIPLGTLKKKVTARTVPHTRVGRHVRFAPHHIKAIVDAGEQPVMRAPTVAEVVAMRAAAARQPRRGRVA